MEPEKSEKPEILTRLEKENNQSDNIKIRARAKRAGGYTVYFDYYHKGKRELKFLNKAFHLTGTKKELTADKEKLKIIISMRNQQQDELLESETGFSLRGKKQTDLIPYFEKLARKKDPNWLTALKHIRNFVNDKPLNLEDITRNDCLKFADYLQSVISANTANMLLSKFKACIKSAIKDEILIKDPSTGITIKTTDTKREYLTFEELQALKAVEKPNFDTCNAFLFSCFTGLRISDLRALTFDNVKDGYIMFKQKKTGKHERLSINENALDIIKEQADKKRSANIFELMSIPQIEKDLHKWTQSAGITKHITFHCARHTFATLCLTYDIDLYTVSKLLGHRDIQTTQIYTKLIDKKKDEAVKKLPKL